MKVGEAIADAIAAESNGPIFGLMGDANMAVWGPLCKDERVRMVSVRHDAAAVLMADGYARATSRLGVATVTSGPGLANCANALLTAARAETSLVLFTGEYEPAGKSTTQALDQRKFSNACEALFRSLRNIDNLAEDIRECFYIARTSKCPVILSLPAEHWEAEYPWEWNYQPSSNFVPLLDNAPQEKALEQLVEQLTASERPVIVAGKGAMLANAGADIVRLSDRIGALLATSLVAKGFFDGNPYDIGISGTFSSAPTEKLMADADFVLGIGASLNYFTTEGGMLFPHAKVARIDIKPFPPEIGVIPGLYINGDARKTTLALIRALESRGLKKEGYRSASTRQILNTPTPRPPSSTDGADPRGLMRVLAHHLPRGSQIVVGGGHFWGWPISHLALPPGGRFQHTLSFGSIGLGLAHGIGAAIGNPDRTTVVIEGDGGILQAIQEFHAAVEQRTPIIVLIMNDSGYGAEVHKMRWKGRDPRGAMWKSPDFVMIARGFGGEGVRIEKESELANAIKAAVKYQGPFLIDARISPSVINDSYSKIYLGQANQAPLLRPIQKA